jgi:multicomponent Na+:H+ antiporter subunit F
LRLLPPQPGHVRLTGLLSLIPHFLWKSVVAGVDVALRAFDPRLPLRPGFVAFGRVRGPLALLCGDSAYSGNCRPKDGARLPLPGHRTTGVELAEEERRLTQAREAARWRFLLAAAGFLLATVALGLARIVRGPTDADRMMSAQLLGTGGVAVLLLAGSAASTPASVDVALILALLAAFASVAFVKSATRPISDADKEAGGG